MKSYKYKGEKQDKPVVKKVYSYRGSKPQRPLSMARKRKILN